MNTANLQSDGSRLLSHGPGKSDWLGNVSEWSTVLLVVAAPLLMGGRHPVGRLVFVTLIGLVALCWLWQRYLIGRETWRPTGLEWLVAVTFGVIALQLVPLPETWLATLSPAIKERLPLWDSSLSAQLQLGAWPSISLHPAATRVGLALFAAYALLFFITAQRLRSIDDVERVLRWIALGAIVMAILGLAQLVAGNGKFLWVYDHPTRDTSSVVRGAFANQNHFAHFLGLGVGPLIWLWYRSRPRSRSICGKQSDIPRHERSGRALGTHRGWAPFVWGSAIGLVLLAGVLTFSRAGVVLIHLAAASTFVAFVWTGAFDRRAWVYLLPVGALLIAAMVCFGFDPLASRLETLVGARTLEDLSAGRGMIWPAVGRAFADFPVLGSGVGTHADVYPMYLEQYAPVEFTHAESGYLQVLEELGVIGFSLLLVAMGTVANWCRPAIVGAPSFRGRLMAVIVTASLALSALHALVDFVWYIPACMTVTTILTACAWKMSRCAVEPGGEPAWTRLPRPLWVAGSLAVTVSVMALLAVHWGPALAARHWDQFARLATETGRRKAIDFNESRDELELEADRRIAVLQRTVECNPRNARAHCRLSAFYLQKFELAQRRAQNSMSLTQIRDAALQSQFRSLKLQDEWLDRAIPENRQLLDRALRHARRAIRLSPLQGKAYVYLAQLGFLRGDGARAKTAYVNQALRVGPFDDAVLMAAGGELFLAGDTRRAAECWKQLYHRAPENSEQITALLAPRIPAEAFVRTFQPDQQGAQFLFAYYRKLEFVGQAHVAGRYYLAKLGESCRRTGNQCAPDDWYQAFVVQDYLGDHDAALDCLREAVKAAPFQIAYRRKYGRQLLRQRRYSEAREQIEWCLRRKPSDESLQRDLRVATRATLSDTQTWR